MSGDLGERDGFFEMARDLRARPSTWWSQWLPKRFERAERPVASTTTRCTGRFATGFKLRVSRGDARDALRSCFVHRGFDFDCRIAVPLGVTVQWLVAFCLNVLISEAAETTRARPDEWQ